MGRLLAYGGAFLLCSCVYISPHTLKGACSNDLGSSIRNFCVVAPGILWRGERPTKADAKWLLEHRVGSVVSVQLDDRRAFEAVALGADYAHSLPYYQVPGFSPLQMLSPTRVDKHLAHFLAILKDAPKPVYVHCRAGVDRTGVLAAAYRVLIERIDNEQAIVEMGRFHSPWQSLDARYIRSLSGEHRAQIMREVADWEPRLRPSARIECLQGKCTYMRTEPGESPIGSAARPSRPD